MLKHKLVDRGLLSGIIDSGDAVICSQSLGRGYREEPAGEDDWERREGHTSLEAIDRGALVLSQFTAACTVCLVRLKEKTVQCTQQFGDTHSRSMWRRWLVRVSQAGLSLQSSLLFAVWRC